MCFSCCGSQANGTSLRRHRSALQKAWMAAADTSAPKQWLRATAEETVAPRGAVVQYAQAQRLATAQPTVFRFRMLENSTCSR